jgi:hypothetical protein
LNLIALNSVDILTISTLPFILFCHPLFKIFPCLWVSLGQSPESSVKGLQPPVSTGLSGYNASCSPSLLSWDYPLLIQPADLDASFNSQARHPSRKFRASLCCNTCHTKPTFAHTEGSLRAGARSWRSQPPWYPAKTWH